VLKGRWTGCSGRAGICSPSLTVLIKSRHYVNFFKQEVILDEGTGGV
jgi:hypothetical protein